jgi:hypothetical protein
MIGFYLIFYTTMTEVIGNDQASNDQVDVAPVANDTDVSKEEAQEKMVPAKDFYKVYGQNKAMEKRLQELEAKYTAPKQEEDYGNYQKEDVDFIEKRAQQVAERKFNELSETREKTQLQQKEEQAFLESHPEAIQHLDDIYVFKKNNAPKMSLVNVWK